MRKATTEIVLKSNESQEWEAIAINFAPIYSKKYPSWIRPVSQDVNTRPRSKLSTKAHNDTEQFLMTGYRTLPRREMEALLRGTKHRLGTPLQRLNPYNCPGFANPVKIQVVNQDPLDEAITIKFRMGSDHETSGENHFPAVVNAVAFREGELAD